MVRTSLIASLGIASLLSVAGCSSTPGSGESADAIEGNWFAANLPPGSVDEKNLLEVLNKPTAALYDYLRFSGVSPKAIEAIYNYRNGDDWKSEADDESFDSVAEVDAVPFTDGAFWSNMLAYVKKQAAPLPAGACGRGTAAEIQATPRADRDIELLATTLSRGSGFVTATQENYDRVARDVATLRLLNPFYTDHNFSHYGDGSHLTVYLDNAAEVAKVMNKQSPEWNCLNAHYKVTSIGPLPAAIAGLGLEGVTLTFDGVYAINDHDRNMDDEYRALAGVQEVEPDYAPNLPRTSTSCVRPDHQNPKIFHYFFKRVSSYVEKYHAVVAEDGTVLGEGTFDGLDPTSVKLPEELAQLYRECVGPG